MNLKKPKFWDYKSPNIFAYLLLPLALLIQLKKLFESKSKLEISGTVEHLHKFHEKYCKQSCKPPMDHSTSTISNAEYPSPKFRENEIVIINQFIPNLMKCLRHYSMKIA